MASWKSCGFDIKIENGMCTDIHFNEEFAEYLRTEVDGPEAQKIAENFSEELRTKKKSL